MNLPIHGYAESDFADVKTEFIRNFEENGEIGAARSIYHEGNKVVDLWGGYSDCAKRELLQENTIVKVYSITKGLLILA